MDGFANNTLRTLGIILTSIFVILGCLVLLLLALCFGILSNVGGSGQANGQTAGLAAAALVACAVLIVGGVSVVSTLAKGIVRGRSEQASTFPPTPPYTLIPPGSHPAPKAPYQPPIPPVSDEAKLDQALARYETMATGRAELPHKIAPAAEPTQLAPASPTPPVVPAREPSSSRAAATSAAARPIAARPIDVRHLSPASRTAIAQLAYAILAKIAAEVLLGIVGWYNAGWYNAGSYNAGRYGTIPILRAPFPVYRFGFMAWGLAAIAPHLVLLYALARRPGPRAFAYSLVIPSLQLLFGIFGHSAFLVYILRAGQSTTPLLTIIPLLLDVLILYLAWKAIRLTGIEPSPTRLVVASAVILLYTSLMPVLVMFLQYARF
jgi:hypothetical protein